MSVKTEDGIDKDLNQYLCPLCGGKFNESYKICSSCPFAKRCSMICCPHCGYQFVDTNKYGRAGKYKIK